jgi:hypothetical protein
MMVARCAEVALIAQVPDPTVAKVVDLLFRSSTFGVVVIDNQESPVGVDKCAYTLDGS